MKTLCCLLAAAALLCGCKPGLTPEQSRQVAAWEKEQATAAQLEKMKSDQEAQARALMLPEVTNQVVGLRSIIQNFVNTQSQDTNQWTGFATVEYINHAGGVDRTNLFFQFRWVTNVLCNRHFCAPWASNPSGL